MSGDELELETPVKKKFKMGLDETQSKPSDGHNGNLQAHKSGSSSNWPSPRSSSSVEMQPNEQLAQRTTHLTLWTKIGKSEAKVLPKKSKGTIRLLCLELSSDGKLILSSQVVRNNGTIENNGSNQDCEDLDDLLSQRRKTPYARINRASFGAAPGKGATLSMRQLTACASRSPMFTICDSLHCPMTHSCILNYGTSVVDFSWSAGGYQLMACSSASEVAYLDFAKCDLGRPYRVANAEGQPDEEDDEYWHNIPVKTNAQWRAYLKKGTH